MVKTKSPNYTIQNYELEIKNDGIKSQNDVILSDTK